MPKIKDITAYLDRIAPPAYQENYDNSGLIAGEPHKEITGVLVTLDVTEDVVEEASKRSCNLIVAHHPIIFKGLKRLTGSNYVERTVMMALRNDIAIYAIHTNLDNVHTGVNRKICEMIGLEKTKILAPKKNLLKKLEFFVPEENTKEVLNALHRAGAGEVGNYDHCSFRSSGTGSFRPGEGTKPHIGAQDVQEEVKEHKAEVLLPAHKEHAVLQALFAAHPYEEVAYYLFLLENENQEVGSGMVGELPQPMQAMEFLRHLKRSMNLNMIRYTKPTGREIRRVAVCGGAGSFLLGQAKRSQADVFITADFKYHEFFDAEDSIMIADIGHYESEVYTKDLLVEILNKKFANIASYLSEVVTNPIAYL
ncbi:Nif3-like dinuclear metal center hexameric protein [Roseivirga sp. BDSF3-8]|uniref:Nif3-like dinuclear metal center hexameric protein n=1 Tax=Roseivirga sp. BDSF3-8 TaxID=3241598 RepID=UPI0035318066